jgi:hypothetical protein
MRQPSRGSDGREAEGESPAQERSESDSRTGIHVALITAGATVIAALAGVVGAVVGKSQGSDAPSQAVTVTATIQVPNDSSVTEPSATSENPPTGPAPAASADPAVIRWQGRVRLTSDGLVFDPKPPEVDSYDMVLGNEGNIEINWSTGVSVWSKKTQPTKSECSLLSSTQALSSKHVFYSPKPGLAFCFITQSGKREAFVRVAQVSSNGIQLDSIVWENEG